MRTSGSSPFRKVAEGLREREGAFRGGLRGLLLASLGDEEITLPASKRRLALAMYARRSRSLLVAAPGLSA